MAPDEQAPSRDVSCVFSRGLAIYRIGQRCGESHLQCTPPAVGPLYIVCCFWVLRPTESNRPLLDEAGSCDFFCGKIGSFVSLNGGPPPRGVPRLDVNCPQNVRLKCEEQLGTMKKHE